MFLEKYIWIPHFCSEVKKKVQVGTYVVLIGAQTGSQSQQSWVRKGRRKEEEEQNK